MLPKFNVPKVDYNSLQKKYNSSKAEMEENVKGIDDLSKELLNQLNGLCEYARNLLDKESESAQLDQQLQECFDLENDSSN